MRLPIQIATIIYKIENKQIKILLLKRIPKKGGFWQYVSGGLEEGETTLECMKREVKEETGIKKYLKIYEHIYTFQFKEKNKLLKNLNFNSQTYMTEIVYAIKVDEKTKIDMTKNIYVEHSEYKWLTPQECFKILKYKNNIDAIKKLIKIIS
ncbi:NUDIX domain-containing protein [Candidatus Woesearchaeota archaeon]|nr:NUDIX domain-containing protein [Candidatus Woesearchaeota archaeon]MCF7901176.1 NUDIX domain-containing protein [Candidatus Woesearchaeota archaeon]MCF8013810.1 NUDIX domain-containing protein [Candidatus Woesearchaeota archaeon]